MKRMSERASRTMMRMTVVVNGGLALFVVQEGSIQ